mgnify:CR=1 FL=1|jgi:MoaA/NifB/PqqE/SkfB family radical SAM enzyme
MNQKQIFKFRKHVNCTNDIELIKPPELVEIILNNKCNFRCKMCNIWKNKHDFKLSIEKLKDLIDHISLLGNNLTIQFLGGETLLYEDLVEAINYTSSKNIRTVITTNSSLLTKNKIIELGNAGLCSINLSLDSIDSSIHDFLRGTKNSHKKVIESIKLLNKYAPKIRININTIIMSPNTNGLKNIVNFVQNNKSIDQIYFIALEKPYNSTYDSDWRQNSPISYLWPDDKKLIKQIFNELIKLKNDTTSKISNSINQLEKYKEYYLEPNKFVKQKGCIFGFNHLMINHLGTVSLCTTHKEFSDLGNITKKKITDIWKSKKASIVRQKMFNCKQNCVQILSCVYKDE